jgi:hypothetical protein
MSPSAPSGPVLPSSWPEVLAQVQEALQQAEEAAARREDALAAAGPPDAEAAERQAAWQGCLDRLQVRLSGLESCAERARQNVSEAEAAITAGEEVIHRWLAACQTAAQKLAEQAPSRVG